MQPSIVQGILGRDDWTLAGDGDDGGDDETGGAEASVETAVGAGASTEDEEGGWDCNRSLRHPCL